MLAFVLLCAIDQYYSRSHGPQLSITTHGLVSRYTHGSERGGKWGHHGLREGVVRAWPSPSTEKHEKLAF
jgi:hypothetical protein